MVCLLFCFTDGSGIVRKSAATSQKPESGESRTQEQQSAAAIRHSSRDFGTPLFESSVGPAIDAVYRVEVQEVTPQNRVGPGRRKQTRRNIQDHIGGTASRC